MLAEDSCIMLELYMVHIHRLCFLEDGSLRSLWNLRMQIQVAFSNKSMPMPLNSARLRSWLDVILFRHRRSSRKKRIGLLDHRMCSDHMRS